MCNCNPGSPGSACGCTFRLQSQGGICAKHGTWLGGIGCPSCAYELGLVQQVTSNVAPGIPPGHRLISDEQLRRLDHLIDELVSLIVELDPPDVPPLFEG